MYLSTLREENAVYIGRFQPAHLGHYRDLQYILRKNQFSLVILVMCPWFKRLNQTREIYHPAKNPFTYYERCQMIKLILGSLGCDFQKVFIIPEPDNWQENPDFFLPDKWKWYIQMRGELALEAKVEFANKFGINFEVLPNHVIDASKVRQSIAKGHKWERMVPKNVAKYLRNINADKRLVNFYGKYGKDMF